MIKTHDEYREARNTLLRRYRNAIQRGDRTRATALRESIAILNAALAPRS